MRLRGRKYRDWAPPGKKGRLSFSLDLEPKAAWKGPYASVDWNTSNPEYEYRRVLHVQVFSLVFSVGLT